MLSGAPISPAMQGVIVCFCCWDVALGFRPDEICLVAVKVMLSNKELVCMYGSGILSYGRVWIYSPDHPLIYERYVFSLTSVKNSLCSKFSESDVVCINLIKPNGCGQLATTTISSVMWFYIKESLFKFICVIKFSFKIRKKRRFSAHE